MAQEFKHLVRIVNTDLQGEKHTVKALTGIKGVGDMFANAVCSVAKIDKTEKIGNLDDEAIKRLDEIVKNPASFGIPEWLFNRKRDPTTGEDKHFLTTDLIVANENDVKMMKKIKSYRGVRHMFRLPVRGQKTRSNFRRNKGKGSLGVRVKSKKSGTT